MITAYLSIGSNVEPVANIRRGLGLLQDEFGELQLSPVYRSAAVGFEGDAFLNLAAALRTDSPVAQLAATLDEIENRCGRVRNGVRFGPRTLDLDLLTYGDLVIDQPGLKLPRDEILSYAFVLRPLADLAPDALHPTSGRSYASLWAERAATAQALSPAPDIDGWP